jgi:hypothetical protein
MPKLRLHLRHLLASIGLFLVLAFIAFFVRDRFIRPFIGDVLVVIWLYLTLAAFIQTNGYWLATGVLAFACALEVGQYFGLVRLLGLEHLQIARVVLGATFDWLDLLAYALGWLCVMLGLRASKASS